VDYEEMLVLLEADGASFVVHRHAPLRSVAEAFAAGLPIDDAAKTLAVMAGGDLVLVVIPAVASLDLVALGAVLGAPDVRLCSPAELAQLGGELGALCPFPVGGAAVVVDYEVARNRRVLCGSGRRDRSLELSGSDLVRLSGASVQRIATPRPHRRTGEIL
jgi:prolyl-tRNA editing enzyme YbaK/EbsC (Cys-tRNA(Pro) deacylase)